MRFAHSRPYTLQICLLALPRKYLDTNSFSGNISLYVLHAQGNSKQKANDR